MKIISAALLIPLLLTACGSFEEPLTNLKAATDRTLLAAKERTLGPSEPKLRLTKADPSRYLPQSTSLAQLRSAPTQTPAPPKMLLAKNTPKSKSSSPRSLTPEAEAQTDFPPLPPLELPPLPVADTESQSHFGVLPPLDDEEENAPSDRPTPPAFSQPDSEGKGQTLPPKQAT